MFGLVLISRFSACFIEVSWTIIAPSRLACKQKRASRSTNLRRKSWSTLSRLNSAKTLHHRASNRRRRSTQNCGRCTSGRTRAKKPTRTMCTTIRHAITRALAATDVRASRAPTIARNTVTVHRNALIAFQVVVAKLNATQNSVRATWRYVNAIPTCVSVAHINFTWQKWPARTWVSSGDCANIC